MLQVLFSYANTQGNGGKLLATGHLFQALGAGDECEVQSCSSNRKGIPSWIITRTSQYAPPCSSLLLMYLSLSKRSVLVMTLEICQVQYTPLIIHELVMPLLLPSLACCLFHHPTTGPELAVQCVVGCDPGQVG